MDDNNFVIPTYMLTTIDNPFHPLYEYDEWLRYDEDHGYYTNEYLARVVGSSTILSEAEEQTLVNKAIDDIIRLDLQNIYKKIVVDE